MLKGIRAMHTSPMNDFPLKWRWTEEKYCKLSSDELAQIKPLDKPSAKAAWEKSLTFISDSNEFSPDTNLFENIESISSEENTKVIIWLKNRMTISDVIVSWQPDIAVLTNTNLFIKYWDEFCYPTSDDVSIWPKDGSWVIHFHHNELFCYGREKII